MNQKLKINLARLYRSSLFSILAPLVVACASAPQNLPDQKLKRKVDLPRFMGKWYVIASNPTIFESGATNAVETYTWNEAEQRIDVDFRFRQDTPDGKEKKIPQTAFVYDHDTNAEWRIQPFWPLKFGYLIIGLADDYGDTTIGTPGRGNVWIMARKPKLPEARYQEILQKLITLGYDLSKIKKVPQVWG
jgi:apolipoprotein D and lipocalin family protein